MDSELVAHALLDAGKTFIPVIFQWTNDKGEIQNEFDTDYAMRFCQKYGLTPIIETINIENLWTSTRFRNLSEEFNITSPQLVTHAYMVLRMNDKYPNRCHLFGGEVRYTTDYGWKKDENSAMVIMGKVASQIGRAHV